MRTSTILCLAAALVLGACSDERDRGPGEAGGEAPTGDSSLQTLEGRTFERHLVLLGTTDDSILAIPWLLTARTGAGGVGRSARGLVLRGSEWEPVFADDWEDPPTRAPWRILPRGGMRILVGMDDAIERIVYEDGVRQLEVALGATLTERTGPRGGSYRLLEGSALVGGRAVEGLMLDVRRSWGPDEPVHGDWAFLVSGDSLQVVLHSPRRQVPGRTRGAGDDSAGAGALAGVGASTGAGADSTGAAGGSVGGEGDSAGPDDGSAGAGAPVAGAVQAPGVWQGWARLDFRELRWPEMTVSWAEMRAFERARRDVPVAWRITSPDNEVTGELSAGGVHVEAGEGEGPQLPVSALFGVRGILTIEGRDYPVMGLLRHTQG